MSDDGIRRTAIGPCGPAPVLPRSTFERPRIPGGPHSQEYQFPTGVELEGETFQSKDLLSFDELLQALVADNYRKQSLIKSLSSQCEELRQTQVQAKKSVRFHKDDVMHTEDVVIAQCCESSPEKLYPASSRDFTPIRNDYQDGCQVEVVPCKTIGPEFLDVERLDSTSTLSEMRTKDLTVTTMSTRTPRVAIKHDSLEVAFAEEDVVEEAELCSLQMRCHAFFASKYCDAFIALLVLVDGILLGLQAEAAVSEGTQFESPSVSALGIIVKVLFIVELLARLCTYGLKGLRSSGMMRLDTFVVCCIIFELVYIDLFNGQRSEFGTGSLSIARFFRVMRLAKAARMSANFRTLWLLLSGLHASLITMMWTIFLIMIVSYGYAIVGMELICPQNGISDGSDFDDMAVNSFGSILQAMLTLLQILTVDDAAAIYRPLIELGDHPATFVFYFGSYIMIVSITLMNLVIAVMVEGALDQANQDREAQKALELQRQKRLIPRLRQLFMLIDEDKSGEVSWDEIQQCPETMQDELKNMTKTDDLYEIFQLLDDDDSGTVVIDEFLDGILKASSGDVMLKLQVRRLMRHINIVKEKLCDEALKRNSAIEMTRRMTR
eukprot:TRINITY_DN9401_c0_g2_i1.p1 TRINITY_DN9401_c0_g2~~TRINITY_DN9401_c0_g2_i1.p1  ORF type:complete len:608 (+),score=94.67 TRINITY_DN9401_c0_g2_i1:52-1875(+)